MAHLQASAVRRILILRTGSLGDVVHGLPVLCALRTRFPDAFIAWLVEERYSELLLTHPALDRTIFVPHRGRLHARLQDAPGWWRLRRILRPLRFDVAVDLQGLSASALAGWLSGAPMRIGFDGLDARQRSRWFYNVAVAPTRAHVIDRNLELLSALDIEHPSVTFGLPEYHDDEGRMAAWLADHHVTRPFAVLAVGSSRADKQWSPDRYSQLARMLRQSEGLRSLALWGTDAEKVEAEELVGKTDGAAMLLPFVTLREAAALCRRSNVVVGSDSVLIHLAAAVGARCVGLYGPTPAARNGPYGTHNAVVQSEDGTMRGIKVDDVASACRKLLN